jgi:hypothetical protein
MIHRVILANRSVAASFSGADFTGMISLKAKTGLETALSDPWLVP